MTASEVAEMPKIFQYWGQGQPPDDVAELITSWAAHNPDSTYVLYDQPAAREFISANLGDRHLRAFDQCGLPAMQSDFFRYALIYVRGGVYVDVATECLAPLSEWLPEGDGLTLVRKWHGGIMNGFIAAPAGNKVIGATLDTCVANIEKRARNNVWWTTGPGIFNRLENEDRLGETRIMPFDEFRRRVRLVNELEHKKATHWSKLEANHSIFSGEIFASQGDARTVPKKVVVHLGPHKTSTTTIQTFLEGREIELAREQISLATVRCNASAAYKDWRMGYTRIIQAALISKQRGSPECADTLVATLSKSLTELGKVITFGETLVLSDENLLGPMFGHRFAGANRATGFYDHAESVFRAVQDAYAGHDLTVILYRRNPIDWLVSSFKDNIMKEGTTDLAGFAASVDYEFFKRYEDFYTTATSVLGTQLRIISLDDCSNSNCKDDTVDLFLKAASLDVRAKSHSARARNESLGWGQIELLDRLGTLLEGEDKRKLLRVVGKEFSGRAPTEAYLDYINAALQHLSDTRDSACL